MLAVFFVIPAVSYALEVGDKAPLFDGESTEGTISLKSYFGEKHVVLAFYFADFTPV
jgi:peroxiredoxin Q/BCP